MSDKKKFPLTALLAAVATALVLSTAPDAQAGGCKPLGQVCSTNMSCCSRDCAKPIAKKATALFGICCPTGDSLCGGTTCANLATDPNNCGACGTVCDASQCQTCINGTCGSGCTSGQACNQGTCCTPATSCPAGQTCGTAPDDCGGTINCGSCDAAQCLTCGASNTCVSTCTSEQTCSAGTCRSGFTVSNTCSATGAGPGQFAADVKVMNFNTSGLTCQIVDQIVFGPCPGTAVLCPISGGTPVSLSPNPLVVSASSSADSTGLLSTMESVCSEACVTCTPGSACAIATDCPAITGTNPLCLGGECQYVIDNAVVAPCVVGG